MEAGAHIVLEAAMLRRLFQCVARLPTPTRASRKVVLLHEETFLVPVE